MNNIQLKALALIVAAQARAIGCQAENASAQIRQETNPYGDEYMNAEAEEMLNAVYELLGPPTPKAAQDPTVIREEDLQTLKPSMPRDKQVAALFLHSAFHLSRYALLLEDGADPLPTTTKAQVSTVRELARFCEWYAKDINWSGLFAAFQTTQEALHPDDIAINLFADSMKMTMAKARLKGRSGWNDKEACSDEYLANSLIQHLGKDNPGNLEDLANYCMMLQQRQAHVDIVSHCFNDMLTKTKIVGAYELVAQLNRSGDWSPESQRLLDQAVVDFSNSFCTSATPK